MPNDKPIIQRAPKLDVLRLPVDQMGMEEAAQASAMLQALEKAVKDRRAVLTERIRDLHAADDLGGLEEREVTDQTTQVDLDGVSLRLTKKGGGAKVDPYKLQQLAEEKDIPNPESILAATKTRLDEKAVRAVLAEHNIPESRVFKPVAFEVKMEALAALIHVGIFTEEEIDAITTVAEPTTTVRCVLDKDVKEAFTRQLLASEP
jgi:hypothetical protein